MEKEEQVQWFFVGREKEQSFSFLIDTMRFFNISKQRNASLRNTR